MSNVVGEYLVHAEGPRIPGRSEPVVCGPLGERVIRCRDCERFRKVAGKHFCRRDGMTVPTSGYDFCSQAVSKEES